MSTDFCKSGKVRLKEEVLKPSSLIQVGQTLEIKKNGFNLVFKVIKLISKRVSASEAILCYENVTPESEMNKFNEWFVGKSLSMNLNLNNLIGMTNQSYKQL